MSKASVLLAAAVCLISFCASRASEVGTWMDGDANRCAWTGPTCITNCTGRRDGHYQSCRGCSVYACCVAGQINDNSPCPAGTVWDDKLKQCNKTSRTCYCYPEPETCRYTGKTCIRSCYGRRDGDYQSCHGCSVYASCVANILYDYRPCAPANPPLQWDDISKRCEYKSRTCKCYRDMETFVVGQSDKTAESLLSPEKDSLDWSEFPQK